VEHLTTWQMKVCYVDPENLHTHQRPQVITFPQTSTERAELENFADAVREKRPLAIEGGDEAHGVRVLEAILESAKTGTTITVGRVAQKRSTPKRKSEQASKRARKPLARKPGKPAKKKALKRAPRKSRSKRVTKVARNRRRRR